MKRWLGFLLLACMAAMCNQNVFAQEKKWVSGTLKDASGAPVIYATVVEKGTTHGATTNEKGDFRIQVSPGATLVISSVGFTTLQVPVGNTVTFNLVMEDASKGLNEVVVTALGITRQKKSVGYAMQEVKGATIAEAHETNLTNALSGVVAGLQVIRSSSGPAGSSKINLRGNNSLTGKNQPLIVVDGIPVDNFVGVSSDGTNDVWNPSLDMGNGLADLNANDIANISVLKGPAAAALYGSRAGNGVILITTKTGKKTSGIGITVSSTLGIEGIFIRPEMQKSFAQGDKNIYDKLGTTSWGPKMTGQELPNWNDKNEKLAYHDNINSFYKTGINHNENISFQQQLGKSAMYTSLNYMNDNSLIPGTKLTRTNLMTRLTSKYGESERLSTDFKVQYSNTNAKNRPASGANISNYASFLYNMPVSVDIEQFRDPLNAQGKMNWYGTGNQVNPYWASRYNQNEDVRNRFIMNGAMKYQFTDWLNAEVKAGADIYTTNTEARLYAGSPINTAGTFSTGKFTFTELNYSALVTARKDNLFGKLGANASVGGNLMQQRSSRLSASTGALLVPDLFSIKNAKGNPTFTDELTRQNINSVYGTAGINWDSYLFLDATMRNDWTSTLIPANRSFFYPSVSLSYVFTEQFRGMPKWFSYGKLRASYAAVGNSLEPYQLYNTYTIDKDPNGNPIASRKKTLYNPNVHSELIKSYEAGAELRFVDNRFGIDVSYYKSNATRQLMDLPMDPGSGYENRKINAGNIQNSGVEVMADAKILDNAKGLSWNLSANLAMNRNKIIDIYSADNVYKYQLGGFDNVSIQAVAGELYGEIYGSKFLRVTDPKSEYFGQLLLSATGRPQQGEQNVRLGNQQAKALLGVTNSFAFKGFTFAFLIDARFGGEMFSVTQAMMQRSGNAAVTAPGGERNDITVGGVVSNGAGGYVPNTTAITTQQYWAAVNNEQGNLGITELNMYDASNIRLRNVQLSYMLPKKLFGRTPVQAARLGVSCNNVWMISSHMRGVDPESVFAVGTNATGFENGAPPTTRTFLVNLNISF